MWAVRSRVGSRVPILIPLLMVLITLLILLQEETPAKLTEVVSVRAMGGPCTGMWGVQGLGFRVGVEGLGFRV